MSGEALEIEGLRMISTEVGLCGERVRVEEPQVVEGTSHFFFRIGIPNTYAVCVCGRRRRTAACRPGCL